MKTPVVPPPPARGPFARPARELWSSPVFQVSADDDLSEADRVMREHHISCLLVLGRDRTPVGVISRSDLLSAALARVRATGARSALELPAACVGDFMTARVASLAPDATVLAAARLLVEQRVHRLFVLEERQAIGVFSTKEVMRAVMDAGLGAPISDWMTSPVETVEGQSAIGDAVDRLARARGSCLIVVDDGIPTGLFTQIEALGGRDLPPHAPVEDAMSPSLVCLPAHTPLFRAAAFAVESRARRIVAVEHRHLRGILTGMDFARAVLGPGPETVARVA